MDINPSSSSQLAALSPYTGGLVYDHGASQFVITQNGEARAVIQDVASYEETKPIAEVVKRLRGQPTTSRERGLIPRELAALGIPEYRQLFFKPYRMSSCHIDQQVVIYVIADGRRDMQSLLSRRVLCA